MAMGVVGCKIEIAEMPFIEVELDPGEAAVGEAGSLFFMDALPCAARGVSPGGDRP
ncbi:MAG TPA: hypothetical protein VLM87_13565 [Rubrivivax sp.]|nr:hypothetical protein [Rubrivivax sp.]